MQFFGRTYLTMFVFNAITLYWISGWHSDDTFLKIGGAATVFVHALFMMIPLTIFYALKKINKTIALFLLPFIWIGYEYFDNIWQFAFPWLELGNTQTYSLTRIQISEFIGVHGLSFLLCLISVLIYFYSSQIYLRKWKLNSFKSSALLTGIIILIFIPNFYGSYRLNGLDNTHYYNLADSTKVIKTAIVQTNTDPFKKWGGNHDELLDSYFKGIDSALKFNPDLIVMHETATPYYFLEAHNYFKSKRFFDLADSTGKYIFMGIPHKYYYADTDKIPIDARITDNSKRKFDVFNSAILIEPKKDFNTFTIHKKVKLVPFSERIPYQEKVPFLKKWLTWGVGISGWQAGSETTIFSLNDSVKDIKFAGLICYESVFSEFVTEFVNKGAEILIIVTNDGWWGNTSGPYQHNQYAVLRAVENRKWIVRCAQTGVSCFIDPLGNIYDEIPYWQSGVIHRNITANSEKTFYTKYGDIIGQVSFYVLMLILLYMASRIAYRLIFYKIKINKG